MAKRGEGARSRGELYLGGQQHQNLAAMLAELQRAVERRDSGRLHQTLDQLSAFTGEYLRESTRWDDRNAPRAGTGFEEVKNVHHTLQRIREEREMGRDAASPELVAFLRDWIARQIRRTDRKYASILKARGLN